MRVQIEPAKGTIPLYVESKVYFIPAMSVLKEGNLTERDVVMDHPAVVEVEVAPHPLPLTMRIMTFSTYYKILATNLTRLVLVSMDWKVD